MTLLLLMAQWAVFTELLKHTLTLQSQIITTLLQYTMKEQTVLNLLR